jgi:clan AA aspartic protease
MEHRYGLRRVRTQVLRPAKKQPNIRFRLQVPEETMGVTHVTVAVCNPADRSRRWEGLFLVDTGAIDCLVPGNRLREIGIEPETERSYESAGGSKMTFPVGAARFEFMGEFVPANVIFGADDVEPILGMIALESVGIEVDPRNQRLKRLPAVRLKRMS